MIHHVKFLVKAMLLSVLVTNSHAQTVDKKVLTLDGANRVIAAALAEAKRLNAPGAAIAVVDDGGNLVAVERLDNTFAAGANISIGKARTAALFKKPTKAFEDAINKGRTTMVTVAGDVQGFTPLQGGIPLTADGQIIGGIGVSGAASAQQDEELALAGAAALQKGVAGPAGPDKTPAAVTHFSSDKVAAGFAADASLLATGAYKINTSRRDKPGLAEVHAHETDIFHFLEGSAVVVTGGKVIDAKTTAPGETRGSEIVDGQSHRIANGDVLVIPEGVPHWFKEVNGPVLYYVVKSISGDEK